MTSEITFQRGTDTTSTWIRQHPGRLELRSKLHHLLQYPYWWGGGNAGVIHGTADHRTQRNKTLQPRSSPKPDEEDVRASERGAGRPQAGSHTTASADRPKGLVPRRIPWHCCPAWRSSEGNLLLSSEVQLPKHLKTLPMTVLDIKL